MQYTFIYKLLASNFHVMGENLKFSSDAGEFRIRRQILTFTKNSTKPVREIVKLRETL